MERKSKGSSFKLRSGNMTSFKMMGATKLNRTMDKSSMPDGRAKSSAFQKTIMLDEVEVSGGAKAERGDEKFKRVTRETDAVKADDRLANLEKEYGVKFKRVNVGGRTQFQTADGLTVKQVAMKQSRAKAKKRDEYIKANKTKKSPATLKLDYKSMTKAQVRDAVIKHNRKGPKTSISMAHAMRMWNKAQERKGKDLLRRTDLEKFDDDRG